MSKRVFISWVILLLSLPLLSQTKVGEVTLPNELNAGADKLILNGGGIREKFMLDLYIGALYLPAKSKDPHKIINSDQAMAVRLHIVSGFVTNSKMEEAMRDGFKNSMGGNSSPLKKEIDDIVNAFSEKIQVGDIYDLIYTPTNGVQILKNGKLKIIIKGLTFKKALFGIWLCNNPADEDLKKGMLGG